MPQFPGFVTPKVLKLPGGRIRTLCLADP